jgi:hypothetical protein
MQFSFQILIIEIYILKSLLFKLEKYLKKNSKKLKYNKYKKIKHIKNIDYK